MDQIVPQVGHLHTADLDFDSGTPYGFMSPARSNSRIQSQGQALSNPVWMTERLSMYLFICLFWLGATLLAMFGANSDGTKGNMGY